MRMTLTERIVAGVVALSVIVGINMAITNTMIDKAVEGYAKSVPAAPKIMIVNMDMIVKDLTSQNVEPLDVLLYTQTLNALLVKEGYLVLDSQDVLSYHPRYTFQSIPSEKLFEAAKKAGIDLGDDARARMEEALVEGKKKVDDLFSLK